MTKYTSAAELARLRGVSKTTIATRIAKGELPGAVRQWVGQMPVWAIPVPVAGRWLKAEGVAVPKGWRKAVASNGGQHRTVWLAAD